MVAIAWTLHWPGVSGAIVGARSPEQVDGWIGAADLALEDDDLGALRDAVEATGAGAGPATPNSSQGSLTGVVFLHNGSKEDMPWSRGRT